MTTHKFKIRTMEKVFPTGDSFSKATRMFRHEYGLEDATDTMLCVAVKKEGDMDYTAYLPLTGGEVIASMQPEPRTLTTGRGEDEFVFIYDPEFIEEDKKSLEDIFPLGFDTPTEGDTNELC